MRGISIHLKGVSTRLRAPKRLGVIKSRCDSVIPVSPLNNLVYISIRIRVEKDNSVKRRVLKVVYLVIVTVGSVAGDEARISTIS